MIIVLAVFAVLIVYDLQKFIKKKVTAKVYVLYVCFMAASLTISLLLAAGRRPSPPSRWIEAIFKMIGVLE
ncbi:MAG TPA: ATP-dependent Clp protease proteolytic subunit [Clostridiaceae bacterium]|nr:ATP-dependent Clp protease proteolytic subunit [Clostridiaceae bacterium]